MQLVFQRTANEPYLSAEIKIGSFILGIDALSFKRAAIKALEVQFTYLYQWITTCCAFHVSAAHSSGP